MTLTEEEKNWLDAFPNRCNVCLHLKVFHVRGSYEYCIVTGCSCDGLYANVDEGNAARLAEHIRALETLEFDKTTGHVDSCPICQEHIATNAGDHVYEFYNYSKSYRRS